MAESIRRRDLLWLGALALLLIATGFGLRDPWPADEPRFALVARDMVLSGDWLFPRVGGDLYPDKPPLYFWLLARRLSRSPDRFAASFLIPSFVAACGTLVAGLRSGRGGLPAAQRRLPPRRCLPAPCSSSS